MGETTDELLGLAARSIVRHAIVGVLTAGVGNALMIAGDLMDLGATIETINMVDSSNDTSSGSSSSSSGGHLHFCGSGDDVPGYKYDKSAGLYYPSYEDYYHDNKLGGMTWDELKAEGKVK